MKIGFIGAGNMGSALADAATKGENKVFIYDKDTDKAKGVAERLSASYSELDALCEACEVIFLGVKPNILPTVSEELIGKLKADTILVSMAAGITLEKLGKLFPGMPVISTISDTATFHS